MDTTHHQTPQDRLFRLSPDLLAAMGDDRRLQQVNPAWSAVLGHDAARLTASPIATFAHPDDADRLEQAISDLAPGQSTIIEVRLSAADRSWRWLHFTLQRTMHHEWLVLGRDVTAERRARDELSAREDRLRRFNAALTGLTRLQMREHETAESVFPVIAETAARALDVRQASVWLFDADHTRIECHYLWRDDGEPRHAGPIVAADAPAYFAALLQGRALAVESLAADPRTGDLAAYGRLNGVEALLDSPIVLDGRLIGVVCHEHDEARNWLVDEQAFAASVADFAAQIIGADQRRRATRELLESQRKLAMHVEQTPMAVLECNIAGQISVANPAAQEIFGYLADQCRGLLLAQLIDPADRDRMADQIRNLREVGTGTLDINCRMRTRLGERRYGDWHLSPQVDGDGRVVGISALCHDVTDRTLARESLTTRLAFEQLMSTISADFVSRSFETIADGIRQALGRIGIFIGARHGWLVSVEESGQRTLYDWSLPESGVLTALPALAAGTADALPQWWQRTLQTGDDLLVLPPAAGATNEPDAAQRDLAASGIRALANVPIVVGNQSAGFLGFAWVGEPERVLSYDFDGIGSHLKVAGNLYLSALRRRATEEALRYSELRFRRMAETVDQVFWLGVAGGAPQYISPRFPAVFGMSIADMMNHPERFMDVVLPEDREVVTRLYTEGATQPVDVEYRIRRPDNGEIRWIRTASYPVPDHSGDGSGLVDISEDITARKLAEAELRERDSQLQHARKMEAFGRLAGGIAHDFNNLLTAITGTAQLAREALEEDHPVQRDLSEIHKAGARAADLTRQLLAFARRQVFAPVVVTVNDTIRRMQHMLRRLIREDIDIAFELDPEPATVRVDPGQLEQVLVNLAVNASDAMPDGGTLTIRTGHIQLEAAAAERLHMDLKPGRFVTMQVIDTGVGIPDSIRPRLFDPFFTTKPVGLGTGLGLSTCYGIVRQSNGVITVDSTPGDGTVFTVWLPRVSQVEDPEKVPEADLPGGSETVLLVEDEPMVRKLTTRILSRLGYRILQASDGEEALRVLDQADGGSGDSGVDLLITDVVMPRMGGRELARRIRDERPAMKVLFVSGYSDDAVAADGLMSHASFLQKPFTMHTLAHRIRDILAD